MNPVAQVGGRCTTGHSVTMRWGSTGASSVNSAADGPAVSLSGSGLVAAGWYVLGTSDAQAV